MGDNFIRRQSVLLHFAGHRCVKQFSKKDAKIRKSQIQKHNFSGHRWVKGFSRKDAAPSALVHQLPSLPRQQLLKGTKLESSAALTTATGIVESWNMDWKELPTAHCKPLPANLKEKLPTIKGLWSVSWFEISTIQFGVLYIFCWHFSPKLSLPTTIASKFSTPPLQYALELYILR